MHHHLEVIMPQTTNISETLERVMAPFSEYCEEEERRGEGFWDWYVIGGRWAGAKESCTYDPDKLEAFYDKLTELKVTVSGVQAGKQALEPKSQIPMVDKLWNEFFPTETGEIVACPKFAHSNNQYDSNDLISCDICRVDEIPKNLTAGRVIIAVPDYDEMIRAEYVDCEEIWTGTNFLKTNWNGKVLSSIRRFKKKLKHYNEEFTERVTPKADWICVTVDYHS